LLFEAFFTCMDVFTYSLRRMDVQRWMNEKFWETEDELVRFGVLDIGNRKGTFTETGKRFDWSMSVNLAGTAQEFYLYRLDLVVYWKQGNRNVRMPQTVYVYN